MASGIVLFNGIAYLREIVYFYCHKQVTMFLIRCCNKSTRYVKIIRMGNLTFLVWLGLARYYLICLNLPNHRKWTWSEHSWPHFYPYSSIFLVDILSLPVKLALFGPIFITASFRTRLIASTNYQNQLNYRALRLFEFHRKVFVLTKPGCMTVFSNEAQNISLLIPPSALLASRRSLLSRWSWKVERLKGWKVERLKSGVSICQLVN